MFRPRFAAPLALIVAMMGLQARAAAPKLPPASVMSDSVLVVHVTAEGISPDSLRTAAQTILGQNAKVADEAITKFKENYDKAIAAGAVNATLVVGEERKGEGENAKKQAPTTLYIKLKPGANVKSLEEMITSNMKAEDKEKAIFKEQDGYLQMREKGAPVSDKVDDALGQKFADALGTISEAAIQVAIVPNEKMKAEITKGAQNEAPVKGLKDAAPVLAESKWMTVAISLGNAPGISLSSNTKDAAAGKSLADSINAALDDVKAQAANPNGGGQLAMFGPLIAPLVEGLRPATNGSQVTVALKGQSLAMIANFAAQFGLLGGGGGGAGGGAGGPPK